ncbi:MAG TPA: metal-dependent hydrolase [Opitutaceae bacterium]|nr:MAG: metal-dependent hydrolase [Verrucomicrobia bacterium ADurb.Bin122]HOD47267.1 metal-dependent hydrolase [Opitutaceae bacterium]HOY53770.1 metal-dependent hydrolase [Opitutaceae bacterium]HPG17239.1 metal-dependent hydrolase [Opitutaceae bacterium]HPN99476.1 metal-dependent hydrolase [Opitutaceae bacterium]
MQLTYFGHSAFLIETPASRIVIDPFLTDNPGCPDGVTPESLSCDYILLTHGHDDHVGDALALARRHGATIVGNFEIAEYFATQGVKTHGLNPGGAWRFPFGRLKLTLAQHSSSLGPAHAPIYLGTACGLLLEFEGRRIYHAGDTALFSDMQLIARGGLDLALLPIGDNYTMGPDDALDALDWLKPTLAIPMHYDTWPHIRQDAHAFARAAAARGHTVQVMRPGQVHPL